jgi:hypothetical protein
MKESHRVFIGLTVQNSHFHKSDIKTEIRGSYNKIMEGEKMEFDKQRRYYEELKQVL